MNLKNITLIALTASCFIQTGAQLFAVSMIASTLSAAPPRSLAMLQGEYGYNSSSYWKTQRQKLILFALTLFIMGGLVAALFLEPLFADLIKNGFSDQVDPALQAQAQRWYMYDWMVWTLSLVSGLMLLVALTRPVTIIPPTTANVSN